MRSLRAIWVGHNTFSKLSPNPKFNCLNEQAGGDPHKQFPGALICPCAPPPPQHTKRQSFPNKTDCPTCYGEIIFQDDNQINSLNYSPRQGDRLLKRSRTKRLPCQTIKYEGKEIQQGEKNRKMAGEKKCCPIHFVKSVLSDGI